MSRDSGGAGGGGLGIGSILLVVFITLKLAGIITWPWYWVLSPLWIPIALVLFIFAAVLSGTIVLASLDWLLEKRLNRRTKQNS